MVTHFQPWWPIWVLNHPNWDFYSEKMKSRPFCKLPWPQDLTTKLGNHYKFVSMYSLICKKNAV
jgi:hypothetical protein